MATCSVRRLGETLVVVVFLLALFPLAEASSPLTNADVEKLVASKVSDSVILDLIRAQPGNFDLSAAAIVHLKQKGVSDAVIEAIIKKAAEGSSPTPTPSAPPPQAAAPNSLAGSIGVTWHNCRTHRFCYQTGTLAWSQDGIWFTVWDHGFYLTDATTGLEFSLSWSAIHRICLDAGPWNTWVKLYAADSQEYKFLVEGLHSQRTGSSVLDDIGRAKESGAQDLKHLVISYSCG
jgi:hypothetical protein